MLPDDSSCVLSGVSFLIRSCNAFFHPFTVCEFLVIAKTAWVNQRWFTVSHPGEYHLTCKQTLFPISSSKGMLKRNVSKPKARVQCQCSQLAVPSARYNSFLFYLFSVVQPIRWLVVSQHSMSMTEKNTIKQPGNGQKDTPHNNRVTPQKSVLLHHHHNYH